jgi:hypothetical protein
MDKIGVLSNKHMNTQDIQVTHGASFSTTVSLTDSSGNAIDLTPYTLQSYIKLHYGDTGYWTNLNPSGIVPISGIVNLSLTASGSTGIPVGLAFYDLILSSGSITTIALGGKVYVSPSISFAPNY